MLLKEFVYGQQNTNVFDFLLKFACDCMFAMKKLKILQNR